MNYYQLSAYDYDLPQDLIAQFPIQPRDKSRLMVVDRSTGKIEHRQFDEIEQYFHPNDQLILNNTKVIPARLLGYKDSGAKIEILLSKDLGKNCWEVMSRPARKMPKGAIVRFSETFYAEVKEDLLEGLKILEFHSPIPFMDALHQYGHIPIPPYIRGGKDKGDDKEWYQTVYAAKPGAVAAPTAGFHFTQDLLTCLEKRGIQKIPLTLHVGLGTIKLVQKEDIREHQIHEEFCEVPKDSASKLNSGKKQFQLCVGTTTLRTLETASDNAGTIKEGFYKTSLFVYPGYQFKFTRALLTNFHVPKSTLLMLVSAFGGYDLIRNAYQIALKERYRFYSYGDAMLII